MKRSTLRISIVVGTRPNFVKAASIIPPLKRRGFAIQLVHTGQHYDHVMSKSFFTQLHIPKPTINLQVGSSSHLKQIADIMVRYEQLLSAKPPAAVIVIGDVNSTLAAALTAAKLHIPLIHVEAGLRSRNRAMQEEINRITVDHLSDYLFVTEKDAIQNLKHEGIASNKIHFVGNTMIDTLLSHTRQAKRLNTFQQYGLKAHQYGLVTLHRPELVDNRNHLQTTLHCLQAIQQRTPLVFPLHPRTRKILESSYWQPIMKKMPNLRLVGAQEYLHFLNLMMHAQFVLTDSGGIQEETTVLRVPCITLRRETERPVTITSGTNTLAGYGGARALRAAKQIRAGTYKRGTMPELWDGKAGERIASTLHKLLRHL